MIQVRNVVNGSVGSLVSDRKLRFGRSCRNKSQLNFSSECGSLLAETGDGEGRIRGIENPIQGSPTGFHAGGKLSLRDTLLFQDLLKLECHPPRLDLMLCSNRMDNADDLVRRLDPALKPAERGEPTRIVVHTLYRPVSFFDKDGNGDTYAYEVECLLDLHDAHLEQQAMDFLEKLSRVEAVPTELDHQIGWVGGREGRREDSR